jgi:hypothetical protein
LTGFHVEPARPDSRWVANAEASTVGLSWHGYSSCDFDRVVFHNGLVHTYASDAVFLPEFGVGVFVFANSAPSDVGRVRRELLLKLQATGALVRRDKRAPRAPRLEHALAQLLDVYNHSQWDSAKYAAMLSEGHKQNITEEREHQEINEYRELHGACQAGAVLEYSSKNVARFLLDCEKARLEMALYLNPETGLIDGFVGHSSGVEPFPPALMGAKAALELMNRWDEAGAEKLFSDKFGDLSGLERLLASFAEVEPCTLGALIERDGNRWQRFRVSCQSGPGWVMALHLEDADPTRVDGFSLAPTRAGACAER